jgi:hypothetical protein
MSNKSWDMLRHDTGLLPSIDYLLTVFQSLESFKYRCDNLQREFDHMERRYYNLIEALENEFDPDIKSDFYCMDIKIDANKYVAALTTKKTGKKKK